MDDSDGATQDTDRQRQKTPGVMRGHGKSTGTTECDLEWEGDKGKW